MSDDDTMNKNNVISDNRSEDLLKEKCFFSRKAIKIKRRINMKKENKEEQAKGPSKPSKVNSEQQEWHTVTSDDEEAYVNEMKELYKD